MNVITICNQKGGTAKTTTAAALAVQFARKGVPTHVIDMDPQASLTAAFGQADPEGVLYRSLADRAPLSVIPIAEYLTLTPSSIDLSRGETEFIAEAGREYMLRTCIEKSRLPKNAVIIIDSPPSLGVLAVNCLTAARGLLIVVQPGGFELRALAYLEETIRILKDRVNPKLAILGAILTNCHPRRAITDQVQAELGNHYRVFGQVRADAQILYGTTEGSLLTLARSNALDDYGNVVDQLITEITWLRRPLAVSGGS
ncbi:MAG: ParA family protein [Isosphaeraceae bacterium]